MLHAFRLGPIEFPEGDQLVYAALGDAGPVQPVFARSDEEGLRDLVAAAGGEPVQCEPGLATAARSLGLRSGRLPPEALQFRASLAVALALGPEASTIGARELEALVAAFARFWKARTWERFDSDLAVPVVVAARGRSGVHEASVLGGGGEQFGVALYPEAGSVVRMTRLVDEDRLDEVQKIPSISVTLQDEPPYVVRAMEDAHGVPGFPTPLAIGGGKVKLASAADVRLLTAALDAFASMMPHRRDGRGVAGDGSDRCEVSVAMPAPGSTQAPAREADPVRARLRTPRNAPCPCGSGRKYKKCHLAEDEEQANGPAREEARRVAERAAVHAIDERLTERMLRLAELRWGRKFDVVDALGAIGIPAQEADFFSAFAAHHFPGPEGIPPRELLLREEGRKLTQEDRVWLDAQAAALVSVWEVTDVAPGQGISLRNLLGEEERFVREVAGSRVLKPRDTLLGRLVDHAGTTLLCGIHPRALPPREGSLVVKAIRKAVRSRARVVPRNKLLEAAADGRLLGLWQTAALAMERRPFPELRNTDGERLLLTTDHFTVSHGAEVEVRARLSAIAGAETDDVEDSAGNFRVTFTRPGHTMSSALENTIVGAAEIDGDALRLSTNSVERADALRAIVDQTCAGLVHFRAREHADPEAALRRGGPPAGRGGGGEGEEPPELQAMVRAVKEKHYQSWLDERIPALGGLTPREAAGGKAKDRQALALLVAEIENHEARLPEGQRFDVRGLRRELGLEG